LRTIPSFDVIYVCSSCSSEQTFSLDKECDHNDAHVRIANTESPCDDCVKRYIEWYAALERCEGDPRVWYNPNTEDVYDSEDELVKSF
jgi:hypothetical protein